MVEILKTIKELRDFREAATVQEQTIALIPTMGALHAGHLSLVKQAQSKADIALPYIYVNPTQFAPNEDLGSYPRTLEDDIQKLEAMGVTHLWLPQEKDVYPNGPEIDFELTGMATLLEGEHRPHFFNGVATVVIRLFLLLQPDKVILGEKDFQQLMIIRKLVEELNLPIEIIDGETVRDENGLALSSRNSYLNDEEYKIAIQLNKIIKDFAQNDWSEEQAVEKILNAGFDKVDYCTKRNAEGFGTADPTRVLVAAWLGKTRLIDNIEID